MNYTLQSKEVKKMYQAINNPVNYGGLELKNRIIFAPTTFGLSDEEYFEKIRKIAAGGCAMIIVGDVPVGKSTFEKSLFDKKALPIIRSLPGSFIRKTAVSVLSFINPTPICSPC